MKCKQMSSLIKLGSKAGKRHRSRCRWHWHFGILHVSPVPVPLFRYRTGSCLGIFIPIPIPDSPDAEHAGILFFKGRFIRTSGIPHLENFMNLGRDTPCTSKLQVVDRDAHCTPIHGCSWCHPSYMMLKNNRNTGKELFGIGIVAVSQLPQSGIGNPAAGSVRYRW